MKKLKELYSNYLEKDILNRFGLYIIQIELVLSLMTTIGLILLVTL